MKRLLSLILVCLVSCTNGPGIVTGYTPRVSESGRADGGIEAGGVDINGNKGDGFAVEPSNYKIYKDLIPVYGNIVNPHLTLADVNTGWNFTPNFPTTASWYSPGLYWCSAQVQALSSIMAGHQEEDQKLQGAGNTTSK